MIISCPECSGPFELEDSRIAALVQIECPSCKFRMILDFAAANDASLIENGMRMASGFRSAADYHASVAAPALAPVPDVDEAAATRVPPSSQPMTTPQPGVPTPTKPTRTKTVVGPFPAPPPAQGPMAEGAEGQASEPDYEDEAPTQLHQVAQRPAESEQAAADAGTPEPLPPVASVEAVGVDAAVSAASRATVEVDPPVAEAMAKGERPPPHTPPGVASTAAVPDKDVGTVAPATSSTELDVPKDEAPKSSPIATLFVAALLLIVVGLVGASVATKGTPDPRPFLEDLLRGN